MRTALLAALVGLGTTALAAPRAPVTAFLPPAASDAELQPLALLIEARASELVEETKKTSQLHLKQVFRAISEESFTGDLGAPANVDALRQALGADRVVAFTLETTDQGFTLSGLTADGKKPTTFTAALPKAWPAALEQGSIALAKALLGSAPPAGSKAQPSSTNEEALKSLASCYPVVIRQPISPDSPTLIDPRELDRASTACERALTLDPSLRYARATLALAQAILGRDEAATKTLESLGATDDMLELYTLARFWLLTRYQSNEAGIAFLKDVVKRRPGELVARSYLGDTQFAVGAWKDAEQTFTDYVAAAPSSAWAWGRLSKALARQGRNDEAVTAAKKGFAVSPTSPEARLELGSRLIDAGKATEAQEILEPLARLTPAKGEHLVRLGWAHWVSGQLDAATAYFQRALDVAITPSEWRTRGRAAYDLALVEAKRGKPETAKRFLKQAWSTGLKLREVDPSLTEIARELERADLVTDAGARAQTVAPKETSLFPLDAFGDLDVNAKKPPPPQGLVLFRF